ncbi:prepilin peptidase [Pseudobutyrivibrio sp.]|uniref:prepilin peptidase n=1 Tax=Pseudobutyrivibrio sp. TaxID=2014367 RepID=UPI0025F35780|nr:prepilin peptidase [Pseudobutyrivibrio sp.]MBR5648884.1 prepilin peptidase [Pseudobutyrivibrio sp.]
MREIGLFIFYGLTAFDDIKTKQVRMLEIIVFGILGIIVNIVWPVKSFESIICGLLVGIVLYLFSILTNEKIGKGDCFIIMVSGLYLGFIDVLVLIWISSLLALIYGLITIKRLKKDSSYEMPFVPFLLSGFLLMYAVHSFGSLIL